jgi:hypothetical protein
MLTAAGALGFWLANFAISRTPMAAEYRAALSIAYIPMLLEALLGGLILGACISYALLRFFDRLPTENPILKCLFLSSITLVAVTVLVEVPAKLLTPTIDHWRYFLFAGLFNVVRFSALGAALGYAYVKLGRGVRAEREVRDIA